MLVVEHDLAILDLVADSIHVTYGEPGAFGVVTTPKSTRNGINEYLSGYLENENMRIRPDAIEFEEHAPRETTKAAPLVEYPSLEKSYGEGEFSLSVEGGAEAVADRGRAVEGERFDRRRAVYAALRESGVVPKTGFKFGADFRTYADVESVTQFFAGETGVLADPLRREMERADEALREHQRKIAEFREKYGERVEDESPPTPED